MPVFSVYMVTLSIGGILQGVIFLDPARPFMDLVADNRAQRVCIGWQRRGCGLQRLAYPTQDAGDVTAKNL